MRSRGLGRRRVWSVTSVLAVFLLVVSLAGGSTATAARSAAASSPDGLATAIFDPIDIDTANADTAFARIKDAGASYVRLFVEWNHVAPDRRTKPAGFDGGNPSSTGYTWSTVDTLVSRAVAAGLTPILDLFGAPLWATGPSSPGAPYVRPSAVELGRFAHAAATRYDGAHGHPRVTYWQVWNEPNKIDNLAPQQVGQAAISAAWYRQMVNAFARGVHRVHADNMVIAGSLAPYARSADASGIPPLTFMKHFLCLTGRQIRPRPTCLDSVQFDIWAMQPYTWGSPVHHASVSGDVALGDLPAVASALDQAWTGHRIVSASEPKFWVTEFSYDTNPPDSGAVAIAVQTRWTAESLYRMWQAGVSLVTWFMIRDQPAPSPWQSGLWFAGGSWGSDTKKTTFKAFRFPVVAFPEGGRTRVWARVPPDVVGPVIFKSGSGSSFSLLGTPVLPVNGIATALLPAVPSSQSVEGVLTTGETSIPFSMTNVPDDPSVDPFGN